MTSTRQVTFAGTKVEFGAHPNMQQGAAPTGVAGSARVADNTNQQTSKNAAAGASTGSNLSCNTCKETFSSVEELRKHFGSELHVRNIRARVEGQPTLDKSEYRKSNFGSGGSGFSRTGLNNRTGDPAFGGPAPIFTCNLCQKTYKTAQTLQSHLRSTEHLMKKEQKIIERGSQAGSIISSMSLGSAAVGLHRRHKAHKHKEDLHKEPLRDDKGNIIPIYESVLADDGETVIQRQVNKPRPQVTADDREADVTPERCFFCGFKSTNLDENLQHMLEFHDFTIPMLDKVNDTQALMEYICKKINVAICLVCGENTKKYETLEALRGHMRSADHERLDLSPEYQDFYDVVIDDGKEANVEKIRDGITGQLTIKTASGAMICQREEGLSGAGHRNIRNETIAQREERHLITSTRVEENALILRERQELMAPERKAEIKIARENNLREQRHNMKVSVRANKLHPKGWDGNVLMD